MPQELGAAGYLARPPIPPPQMPTLSTMKPPMASNGPDEQAGGGELQSKAEGVLLLFFRLKKDLEQLALVAPGQSEAIDDIMTKLKDVRIAIINGGADKDNTIPEETGTAGPIR